MTWIETFEKDLKKELSKNEIVAGPYETRRKKSNNKTFNLFLSILILIVFIFIVFQNKKDKIDILKFEWENWTQEAPEVESRPETKPPLLKDPQILDIQSKLNSLQKEYESLSSESALVRKRNTLLAIINNNNWCVIKNNLNKNDLIYLMGDWKISQYPKHINLSESDREFLKEFVRSN